MNRNILIIRIFFLLLCAVGSLLVAVSVPEWSDRAVQVMTIGMLIGVLVVLVDISLKGFSLRGMTALTFGLGVGALIAFLVSSSPLLEEGDPQVLFLSRLGLYVVCSYLGAVIALRGKDEFNLMIPYVRFVPHGVDVPLVVVDAGSLIDGRVARICQTRFISAALIIPRFVLTILQRTAESEDPVDRAKGRRGLLIINQLREIQNLEVRVEESDLSKGQDADAKLLFIASSLKAKLLTTDTNLAKLAEFQGITWLNVNDLAKAVSPEYAPGEVLVVKLVKTGKEAAQAVGYLEDGCMVIVPDASDYIGREVAVEVMSVIPSGSSKMIFGKFIGQSNQ